MKTLYISLFFIVAISGRSQTLLDTAINFTVKDVHGQSYDLYDILDQDKYVVIDFFSVACGTCAFYAPDLVSAYQEFGCNQGNMFFMSIDKGNDNLAVMEFDSIYGIEFPSISGTQGGGNLVHMAWEVQGTPTIVMIHPDRSIVVNQVYPPSLANLLPALESGGGIFAPCFTGIDNEPVQVPAEVEIYPNPGPGLFNIAVNTTNPHEWIVEVYNLQGSRLRVPETRMLPAGRHKFSLNLSVLDEGVYFLKIFRDGLFTGSHKVVIRRD